VSLASVGTVEDGLAYFDSLAAVRVEEILGAWRGAEVPTGNPLDGLLDALGWHGKTFDGPDGAHPLVFSGPKGLFEVNPALVPIGLAVRFGRVLRLPVVPRLARAALPLLRTTAPKARLRMVEYRGVVTATTCYDSLPIHDHLRRVDPDTLLGAMDLRGLDSPFLFTLRR
jgi:hypothetical protein